MLMASQITSYETLQSEKCDEKKQKNHQIILTHKSRSQVQTRNWQEAHKHLSGTQEGIVLECMIYM